VIGRAFMNKNTSHYLFLFLAVTITLCISTSVLAKVEWSIVNRIELEDSPLDVAVSRDGTTAYILCEKSLLIYSILQNKVTDTVQLRGKFSQVAISPGGENLLLTDTEKKQVSIIRVSQIYDIKIGQSPIIGQVDASVNVFAFLDYQ
jgi:hypothetical protein